MAMIRSKVLTAAVLTFMLGIVADPLFALAQTSSPFSAVLADQLALDNQPDFDDGEFLTGASTRLSILPGQQFYFPGFYTFPALPARPSHLIRAPPARLFS